MIGKLRSILSKRPHREGNGPIDTASGKPIKRCVLHIGTEKTGTSTIQRFLSRNRAVLRREGIVYPAATGKAGGSQWGFVACGHDKLWNTDIGRALGILSESDRVAYCKRFHSQLASELNSARSANRLIISSEHLHSRLVTKEMIERLKEFLDPWVESYQVLFYLRRQDRVAVSLYSTKVKSGNPNPAPFPNRLENGVPYYFDYERIYDNWCAVFGEANVFPRLFSPEEWVQGDLVLDFCKFCGVEPKGKEMPISVNESLGRKATDFLREVNRQLPDAEDGQRNKERIALSNLVSKMCRGKNYPVNREDARSFYQQFLEGNDRLREKAFPGRPLPLFDEDFSDYPETLDQTGPRYEDAVELAIRLWRGKT